MTDTKDLKDILNKLRASESLPDSSEWLTLKKELSGKIEKHIQNYEMLQKTLELSYQETYKMLELFDQRDLLKQSIFDASQDIILTLDENGQVIEFNRAMENLLKLDNRSIMGRKLTAILPDCSFKKDLNDLFSKSTALDINSLFGKAYESTLFDSDGNTLTVLVSISRIQYNESAAYPVYIKNLTNEKAAAHELEESRAQLMLTSKMSALGEMAGGIAHEINTPLAVIQMRSDQLFDDITDGSSDQETLLNAVKAIDVTVKRIAKIISGLRLFSRDGRKDPMILSSISQIVDDTFSLCKEKFSSYGVELEFIKNADIEIECRPSEIAQVLLNMLNNAFDAIQPLAQKWVKIELEQTETSISLKVTDSGCGIPIDVQKKMMQPFFTTKEIGKGTGLGLSISKGLVESHGGSLCIDNSSPNTCLVISLPKKCAYSQAA